MAQGKLGYLYLAGLGVNKDVSRAYAWLKLATLNKNQQASKELARLEPTMSSQDKERGEVLYQQMKNKEK
ncbi:TPR repeat-containing protein [Legionella feeleii]|nr:SEL1-like repeat protein [Legionella feeleii]KTD03183.1 TPR repeat-containing protein [Legionella feeleii]SPX59796.1 TPR repeat protein, SEL1 subfamily [Legionella feeleii]